MRLPAFLKWLLWGRGADVDELARRLDFDVAELRRFQPTYREFSIPKRSGGNRRILAPDEATKRLQRKILRRLLARLRAHPAATGFERGKSIVTNARAHQGQAVVVRMDLIDFFPSTRTDRVRRYFRRIGWNRRASKILLRLCTHDGGLPQGAPTSPRLSNLVNYRLDARLAGMASWLGGVYTRYADDITISLPEEEGWTDGAIRSAPPPPFELESNRDKVRYLLGFVKRVAGEEGYRLHRRKKLSVRRRHHCQKVTGLVVNDRVNLPRATRRWLRAVEHRTRLRNQPFSVSYQPLSYGARKQPSLRLAQLEGWQALRAMIRKQAQE